MEAVVIIWALFSSSDSNLYDSFSFTSGSCFVFATFAAGLLKYLFNVRL